MTDIYLHGIETIEANNGPRPVQTIDTGVIGLLFTADDCDTTKYPLNTPILWNGFEGAPTDLGATGTGADAIADILEQATRASQTIVGVRVTDDADAAVVMGNMIGDPLLRTGMWAFLNAPSMLSVKPKLLIAPGYTSTRPTDGVLSVAVGVAGTGYTEAPTVVFTGDGSGAEATAILSGDGVASIVVTNPGYGYTSAPTISFTGGGGGSGASATATLGTVANPVAINLLSVAARLRAVAIVDGPNTTSVDAVGYRQDFDSDRMWIIDPFVKVADGASIVDRPASARVAGLQARVDYDEGFWYSASNHVIAGVLGTARQIEHSLSDPSAESQYLNGNDVGTVVRSPQGGWKLWGVRAPTSDTLKKFVAVRRSHDTIIESIELAHEPFIDKPFNIQYLTDIGETVNAALRRWQRLGATLGGRVWFDRGLNTKETWANGHLYVSYDAEAPAPIEHITFVFNRNTGYYEELGDRAIREVERLAGTAVA